MAKKKSKTAKKSKGAKISKAKASHKKAAKKKKAPKSSVARKKKAPAKKVARQEIAPPKAAAKKPPRNPPPRGSAKKPRGQSQAGSKETRRTAGPDADPRHPTRGTRSVPRAVHAAHEPDPARSPGTLLAAAVTSGAASRK